MEKVAGNIATIKDEADIQITKTTSDIAKIEDFTTKHDPSKEISEKNEYTRSNKIHKLIDRRLKQSLQMGNLIAVMDKIKIQQITQ